MLRLLLVLMLAISTTSPTATVHRSVSYRVCSVSFLTEDGMLQRQTTLRTRICIISVCIISAFPVGIYGLPFLGLPEDVALAIGAGMGCIGGMTLCAADMDLDVMAFTPGFAGAVVCYGMPCTFGSWSLCYFAWYTGQEGSGGRPAFALPLIPLLVWCAVALRYRCYHCRGTTEATGAAIDGAAILANVRLELRQTTLLSLWACLGIAAQGACSQLRIEAVLLQSFSASLTCLLFKGISDLHFTISECCHVYTSSGARMLIFCFGITELLFAMMLPWIWQKAEMHEGPTVAMYTLVWIFLGVLGVKFILEGPCTSL